MKNIGVLDAELTHHIQESNRRHDELWKRTREQELTHDDDVKELKRMIAGKVDYKTFMIVFTILTSVLGYMIWQMDDIRKKTGVTGEQVAAMNSVFEHNNFLQVK